MQIVSHPWPHAAELLPSDQCPVCQAVDKALNSGLLPGCSALVTPRHDTMLGVLRTHCAKAGSGLCKWPFQVVETQVWVVKSHPVSHSFHCHQLYSVVLGQQTEERTHPSPGQQQAVLTMTLASASLPCYLPFQVLAISTSLIVPQGLWTCCFPYLGHLPLDFLNAP